MNRLVKSAILTPVNRRTSNVHLFRLITVSYFQPRKKSMEISRILRIQSFIIGQYCCNIIVLSLLQHVDKKSISNGKREATLLQFWHLNPKFFQLPSQMQSGNLKSPVAFFLPRIFNWLAVPDYFILPCYHLQNYLKNS